MSFSLPNFLTGLAAGVLLTGAVVFLSRSPAVSEPVAGPPPDWQKWKTLAEERGRQLEARPAGKAPPPTAAASVVVEGASPEAGRVLLGQQLGQKRTRKLEEKLAALRSRLHLTDAQTAQVRALLDKHLPAADDVLKQIFQEAGAAPADTAELMKVAAAAQSLESSAGFIADLDGILGGDQKAAFQSFQQEQAANRLEISTNREMARLQSSLTLSSEQKDKAFAALSRISADEIDLDPAQAFDPTSMQLRREARLQAMHDVLTDEQFRVYEQGSLSSLMEGATSSFIELFDAGGEGIDTAVQQAGEK